MSYQNLVFNQDNNFYLISLSILNSCLLGNVSILQGQDTCLSLLAVKGVILSAHKSCGTASCYRKHSNQKKNANKPSNLELTPVNWVYCPRRLCGGCVFSSFEFFSSRLTFTSQTYPERFYFEGLLESAGTSVPTVQYLPIYFGNVCLRFLPVSFESSLGW